MRVLHIAHYAAPYKGNFIASLAELERQLRQRDDEMVYIFPEKCRDMEWVSDFLTTRGGVLCQRARGTLAL